uniref:peroxisomal ATPase PEX1 isoform X2 n=1 Tax=Myxine glutinosa TaxID=7769 RepID=UPI00358FD971
MRGSRSCECRVRLISVRDCFVRIHRGLVAILQLSEDCAVQLTWGTQEVIILSWVSQGVGDYGSHTVELSRQVAATAGLQDGQEVLFSVLEKPPSCMEVLVEPLTASDWEILELHSKELEESFLDQVRIVFAGEALPIWISTGVLINIKIVSLTPPAYCGRLETESRLLVKPVSLPNPITQQRHRDQQSQELPASADLRVTHSTDGVFTWWSQVFQWIWPNSTRTSCSADESPSVEAAAKPTNNTDIAVTIPLFPFDGLYRVHRSLPKTTSECQCSGCVHVFRTYPCTERCESGCALISRVTLLVERKGSGTERQNRKSPPVGESNASDNPLPGLVRVKYSRENNNLQPSSFHQGLLWAPDKLRHVLGLESTSVVKLQTCPVPAANVSAISLQPLEHLEVELSHADVKDAFLSWLTECHIPSCGIPVGRRTAIIFPVSDRPVMFLLSVTKVQGSGSKEEGQWLMMSPFLDAANIEVDLHQADVGGGTLENSEQMLPFTRLYCLGGLGDVGHSCWQFIADGLRSSHLFNRLSMGLPLGALLITGQRGTGKTSLAGALCKEAAERLGAYVHLVECKTLKGKRGDTVRQVWERAFEEATWRQPAIVFIDDVDKVVGTAMSVELEQGQEGVLSRHLSTVLKELASRTSRRRDAVVLLCTAQSTSCLHPSLNAARGQHLFHYIVHLQPPEQTERLGMLAALLEGQGRGSMTSWDHSELQEIARTTDGFVAQDFVQLVERAVHAQAVEAADRHSEDFSLKAKDLLKALHSFTPSYLHYTHLVKPRGLGWDYVGGLGLVKEALSNTILLPAKFPVLSARLPVRQPAGVLLYGPPGTGKTLLAQATATESGLHCIIVKGPELLNKYIGASEQAVRDVFSRAQAARPCLLLFDEFEALAPRRGHDNTGVTDRVVNQLLTQLDGVEALEGVFVLAATSRPDLIDPALLRPGRFDQALYCPIPNKVERLEILHILIRSLTLSKDVKLEELAERTDGFTGADLKALLYNAQLVAWQRLHSSWRSNDCVDQRPVMNLPRQPGTQFLHMPSLQAGFSSPSADRMQELNMELCRLGVDTSLDLNVEDANGEDLHLDISQEHLLDALCNTQPSITDNGVRSWTTVCENFRHTKGMGKAWTPKQDQKVTLA